jgi:cyclohexyl-isocyanide hydratase
MRAAFVLFDGLTSLDFVGLYDPLTRLKSMQIMTDFHWDVCGLSEEVTDDRGLRIRVNSVPRSLSGYDILLVPGGFASRQLQSNAAFLDWLRTAAPVPLKASVCSGALLLGSAGFLTGQRATTHPNAFTELAKYCEVDTSARVVDSGPLVTARGVTAGIDLGLYLVSRLAGRQEALRVATQMDYPYFAVESFYRST